METDLERHFKPSPELDTSVLGFAGEFELGVATNTDLSDGELLGNVAALGAVLVNVVPRI